jgi:hypothetical protein
MQMHLPGAVGHMSKESLMRYAKKYNLPARVDGKALRTIVRNHFQQQEVRHQFYF